MESVTTSTTRQLFLDNRVIDRVVGVERRFHRPRRFEDNPVLQPERPWELSGGGIHLYGGTVLYDEEDHVFKMWYRTSTELDPQQHAGAAETDGSYRACYATSEDGLTWERPELGLVDHEDSTRNNLLPPAIGTSRQIRRPNLILDYEESDPGRRYKMLYMDGIDGRWALCQGFSADGIHWQLNVGEQTCFEPPIAPNGILFGWDPKRREFVHYHRKDGRITVNIDGRSTRSRQAVMRTSSPDFETWGDTAEALARGEADPPNWNPSHGIDLAGLLYTDDLYVGFVDSTTAYDVNDVPPDLWETVYADSFAEYRTELVISRDGIGWHRLQPHWEFMRPGLWGTWDRHHIGLTKPIVKDSELFLFYSGSNMPMGATATDHPLRDIANTVQDGQRMGHAIGLARMRLDGFASMDGGEEGGSLTTRPLLFDGNRLLVNARAPEEAFSGSNDVHAPYGTLDVELLDAQGRPVAGYTRKDCDTFTGDELNHTVTWCGRSAIEGMTEPARLRFYLTNAALYAFQFSDATPARNLANPLCPGCRGAP